MNALEFSVKFAFLGMSSVAAILSIFFLSIVILSFMVRKINGKENSSSICEAQKDKAAAAAVACFVKFGEGKLRCQEVTNIKMLRSNEGISQWQAEGIKAGCPFLIRRS